MQHLVFVYGTLRKGECNHHFLSSAQFLGQHETDAQFAQYIKFMTKEWLCSI